MSPDESSSSHRRRVYRRADLQLSTPVLDSRNGRFFAGRSRNLSRGGIFVEMPNAPPVGAIIDVFIGGVGMGPQILARIVRVVPGEGFAAQFTSDPKGLELFVPPN
jgi:hypothetical protein